MVEKMSKQKRGSKVTYILTPKGHQNIVAERHRILTETLPYIRQAIASEKDEIQKRQWMKEKYFLLKRILKLNQMLHYSEIMTTTDLSKVPIADLEAEIKHRKGRIKAGEHRFIHIGNWV